MRRLLCSALVLGSLGFLPEARPGPQFVVTFALVIVPTVAIAWLSSRTVEAAGLRLLAMIDKQGRPRDYYAHLSADELEQRTDEQSREPTPATAG